MTGFIVGKECCGGHFLGSSAWCNVLVLWRVKLPWRCADSKAVFKSMFYSRTVMHVVSYNISKRKLSKEESVFSGINSIFFHFNQLLMKEYHHCFHQELTWWNDANPKVSQVCETEADGYRGLSLQVLVSTAEWVLASSHCQLLSWLVLMHFQHLLGA